MQTPTKINIWNQFDEFGLLAGLAHWSDDGKTLEYVRYPGENNKQLKQRTLTANKHRGNATLQGMLNNISRDLSISPSGEFTLPIYNTITKDIFYLSESPYPSESGTIKVFVSTSGTWTSVNEITPQIRASGFADAVSGWIVWNEPDFDPSLIANGLPGSSGWYDDVGRLSDWPSGIQWGAYTRILQFASGSIPNTNERVRIDYQVMTGVDLFGQPVLNWRSDFSNIEDPMDTNFVGQKSEFPTNLSSFETWKKTHVSIFPLNDLTDPSISGVFYDASGRATSKLLEISSIINDANPLYWNKFRYDMGRWNQLKNASIGSIPSFYDESIASLSGYPIQGGSRYGVDLDLIELREVGTGVRAPWYPVLIPGEFYIGNERFYLFGNMQYQNIILTDVGGGLLSGNLTGGASGWPYRLGTLSAYSSGVFFDEASGSLPNNPYFKRLHDFAKPMSGVYYGTPAISYSSEFDPTVINYNGSNFVFNYDTGIVWASGVNPTGFVVTWEHPGVLISGYYVVYSGGYQLTTLDFNPLTDPFDKVFYLNN